MKLIGNEAAEIVVGPPPNTLLVLRVEEVCALLAQCKTVDEVKSVRDKAEAVRAYMRKQRAGLQAQNDAAEIKLHAERRLGELLIEMKRDGKRQRGGHPHKERFHVGTVNPPTLEDLCIPKTSAKRYQDIARIKPKQLDEFMKQTRERPDGEITSKGFVAFAKKENPTPKVEQSFHILIAIGDLRDAVRKCLATWPEESVPGAVIALRDLADEIAVECEG